MFNHFWLTFQHFLYDLCQHIAEVGCSQLSASCGTNMTRWGHWGWGWFPSSRITMLSRGCQWAKCSRECICEDSVPCHPLTGHLKRAIMAEKNTIYFFWCPIPSSTPPSPPRGLVGVVTPRPTPRCLLRWSVSHLAARLNLHSGKCALCRSLSLYNSPLPVTNVYIYIICEKN